MLNYLESIKQIILDIKNNSNLEIETLTFIHNNNTANEIVHRCKEMGYVLSENVLAFYKQVEKFEIKWRACNENNLVRKKGDENNLLAFGSIRIDPST